MDSPEYKTKIIAFRGREINIVYQKDSTSCPLLSLCNSLLLVGDFRLKLELGASTISEKTLINLICDFYMTKVELKGSKTRKNAMKTLRRLTKPILCNMTLTSVEHMETSEELQLFEQLGIKVYHGCVIDPKDEELVRAIGTNTYYTLSAGLLAHKAKTDVHSHSPGTSQVDEGAASHLESVNWDLIDEFFSRNSTQLTTYGFQSLKQHLIDKHTTVCAVFWNHHFHVVLQLRGTLLLLQNSSDQFDTTVVWRYFNGVNGDGLFLDSKFLPLQTALGATVSDGSSTKQNSGHVYVAKSVEFRGRRPFIIYPHMTGPCALVALCNAILLRGDVELNQMVDCNLSLSLAHLVKVAFQACKTPSTTMNPIEWIAAVGSLDKPVHVNMNFTNIYNIEITKELEIFGDLGIRLCHGFIADPEDLNLCTAIGPKYYDVTTESPASHLEAEDCRKLVDGFIKEHDTELTPHGLQSLQEKLCETKFYVIFWKKQFHTAIKCNNRIFVLDPDLRSFEAGKIWRTLDSVDGAGATLASTPYPISGKPGEHKCIRSKCLLSFTSSFNLQRHNYIHPTSSVSKDSEIFKERDEIIIFWDTLLSKEAGGILSLKDMEFKNLHVPIILQILERQSTGGDIVAMALSSIVSRSLKGEKIASEILFPILDEASEKTFLCSNICNCKDERIWAGSPKDIITDMHSLLACYSYLFEKALVCKWLKHKAALAYEVGEDLMAEEKRLVEKKVNDQNIQGDPHITAHSPGVNSANSTSQHDGLHFEVSGEKSLVEKKVNDQIAHSPGVHSANSTSQHDGLHLEGSGEVARENRVQDGQLLEHPEDDSIGNLHDLFLEFFRRFRSHAPKKFYRGRVEAMKYMDDLDMHIHFPHISEYSAELAAYILDHHDSDRVKTDISRAAAQYLIEQNFGKPEKEILEGVNVIIVDLPSPTRNMSFKKYARINKLTRPFKLPKKFRRVFSHRWKGKLLYIMTYAGRKAARGFLNFIIMMHKRRLCWRGEWNLAHMRIIDGLFVIDTSALYPADVDGMAEDFKKYIELLKPYFMSDPATCPPYWEALQIDTMTIPDPLKDPEEFESFHMYLSGHFVFLPPVSIYQFLCLLFSICDGLRPNSDREYQPLNKEPADVAEGWTGKAIGDLFDDVFYFSRNGVVVNIYTDTYWHLLQYTRHFSSHVLSLTKNKNGQDIKDMILIHLMLACRLDIHLASLVRHIVNVTNMQGLYFRAWQSLLASDDKIEEGDLLENLEVSESEDEESDVALEETSEKIEEEYVLQDLGSVQI